MNRPVTAALLRVLPLLVVVSVIVLLPVGRASELPLLIGAIAGIVLVARGRLPISDPAVQLGSLLFACYWIPALLSAPMAVEPGKTWASVAAMLRFLPFLWFVAWALAGVSRAASAVTATGAVVALWVLDAYVQTAFGFGLGGSAESERVSGIFGADNLKLGPVLATLSPFLLVAAGTRFGRVGMALAAAAMVVPVLLAGSRAAWLMYALVCVVFIWREARSARRIALVLAGMALFVAVIAGVALRDSERFDARIERSLRALDGSAAAIDEASAGRLRIWHAALGMGLSHPLTGVGVRGFRHAYAEYAVPGDGFVDPKSGLGAAHAHQILLEAFSETGIVGVLGWFAAAVLAARAWRRAGPEARQRAIAPATALLAMCFPVNTHLALYSAWWGLLYAWLVALYCASLAAPPRLCEGRSGIA